MRGLSAETGDVGICGAGVCVWRLNGQQNITSQVDGDYVNTIDRHPDCIIWVLLCSEIGKVDELHSWRFGRHFAIAG